VGVVEGRTLGKARLAVMGSVGVGWTGAVPLIGLEVLARFSGRSHDVCCCCVSVMTVSKLGKMEDAYPVRVKLKLPSQDGIGDVID
jgi:hypothetical protein